MPMLNSPHPAVISCLYKYICADIKGHREITKLPSDFKDFFKWELYLYNQTNVLADKKTKTRSSLVGRQEMWSERHAEVLTIRRLRVPSDPRILMAALMPSVR